MGKIMNAYGVLVMFSLGMIVLPVGGFFLSKAILFEGTLAFDLASYVVAVRIATSVVSFLPALAISYLMSFTTVLVPLHLSTSCLAHLAV